MKLVEHIRLENINMDLKGKNKKEIIDEMVNMLIESNIVLDKKKILKAINEREKISSTAFADGVALPHPHDDYPQLVKELTIAFGKSKDGVDFDSYNEKPTYLFFLLCATNQKEHLNALANLSRLLHNKDFRETLKNAESAQKVLDIIEMEDN